MPQPRPSEHHLRFLQQSAIALGLTALLGGCAAFPSATVAERIKPVEQYASAQRFAAPTGNWPTENWWKHYDDAQLSQLIEEGLAGSPDMTVATARLRAAEATQQISGSALQPQLNANGSATGQKQSYNYLTPRSMTPEGWQDYGRATLDFNWEIDFWGKNRSALAAATSELEARRADLAQARLSLSTGIAAAYAELVRLFALRETTARAVQVRTQTATLFGERFANGLETRGSQRDAEARQATAEGDLLLIDEQIALQRNRLAALLGAGPDRGLSITPAQSRPTRSFSLPERLDVELLGRRPDIVAARLQAEAQAKRVDEKKAGFYPNVNLAAFIGVQSLGLNMLSKGGSTVGSVGPAISLPIFNGGRLRGELKGARARYDEAVGNYNQTVTQALQEVADAAVSQKALVPRLEKAEQAQRAAEEAHRVALNRYQGGLSSYLEVLSAEDNLLGTQRTLSELRSRSLTLDVALIRSLGGGYHTNEQ